MIRQEFVKQINKLAIDGEAFLFIINYQGNRAYIRKLSEINPSECLYDFNGKTNAHLLPHPPISTGIEWKMKSPQYASYRQSFDIVRQNILAGNSYLTNLTCQIPVHCNLSLRDIFLLVQGKYKLFLHKDVCSTSSFVCFSPETFIQLRDGRIYSYPMKGTMDASVKEARRKLMENKKEAAEHATIVDLIRNDLSRVATEVRVDRYRYTDMLHTNRGDILQSSSQISGKLPDDYRQHIGDILATQLPAGSITGAPKDKTMHIIHEAEKYDRGFYTGVMGICKNGILDSAVMIRFIEQNGQDLVFKAGGGITYKSVCAKEYKEILQKVYLPIKRQ